MYRLLKDNPAKVFGELPIISSQQELQIEIQGI